MSTGFSSECGEHSAGKMCVSTTGLAFAWGLQNGGNGGCPPSENTGSPWIEGEVGKEEVPFLVGVGS